MDDSARSICHGRNDGETSLRQLGLLLQSLCTQGDSGKTPTYICYIDQVMLQHRNKLATATADTGIRIAAEARRGTRGSAREAFLGALGRRACPTSHRKLCSDTKCRPARLTPQAPRKALILGTKVKPQPNYKNCKHVNENDPLQMETDVVLPVSEILERNDAKQVRMIVLVQLHMLFSHHKSFQLCT
jgi:hypothetical protein